MGRRNRHRWVQCPCTCASAVVTRYQKRISNPLLERIDIHIEVPLVDYEKLSGKIANNRAGMVEDNIRVFASVEEILLQVVHIPFELIETQQQLNGVSACMALSLLTLAATRDTSPCIL